MTNALAICGIAFMFGMFLDAWKNRDGIGAFVYFCVGLLILVAVSLQYVGYNPAS